MRSDHCELRRADAELKCNNKKEKNKISFFFLEREREKEKCLVTKDRQQPRSDYLPNFTLLLLPFGFLLPFFFFVRDICIIHSSIHSNVKCVCNCCCCRSGWVGGRFDYTYVMCASHSINTCAAIRGWCERRASMRESHIALLSTSFAPSLVVLLWFRRSIIWNLKKKNIYFWDTKIQYMVSLLYGHVDPLIFILNQFLYSIGNYTTAVTI